MMDVAAAERDNERLRVEGGCGGVSKKVEVRGGVGGVGLRIQIGVSHPFKQRRGVQRPEH